TASDPKPHVTLDASRHMVSRNTCFLSNSSAAVGPPAVDPESTEYVANRAAKRMMSDNRKSQKPKPATTRTGAGPRRASGIPGPDDKACSAALMTSPPESYPYDRRRYSSLPRASRA